MKQETRSRINDALIDLLSLEFPKGVSLRIKYIPGKELDVSEITKNHRKKTPKFRVKYGSDEYSCDGRYESGVQVLLDVIRHVGPQRVYDFNIKTSGGLNLVQMNPEDIKTDKGLIYLATGFWFISKTASSEKKNQIRLIIKNLGENWAIEDDPND